MLVEPLTPIACRSIGDRQENVILLPMGGRGIDTEAVEWVRPRRPMRLLDRMIRHEIEADRKPQ